MPPEAWRLAEFAISTTAALTLIVIGFVGLSKGVSQAAKYAKVLPVDAGRASGTPAWRYYVLLAFLCAPGLAVWALGMTTLWKLLWLR